MASVALLAVAGVLIATSGSEPRSPAASGSATSAAGTAPSAADVDMAQWIAANAPAGAAIVSDNPVTVRRLQAANVPGVALAASADAPIGSLVVQAPITGPVGPRSVTADRTLVPLAEFGLPGSAMTVVQQLVEQPVEQVIQERLATADTTRAADTGLLANAAVTIAQNAREPFIAGTLDLRAAAFLVALTQSSPVQVLAVPVNSVEQSVGLPARRLIVAGVDISTIRGAAAAARGVYAPLVGTPATNGTPTTSVLLTWPLSAETALTLR